MKYGNQLKKILKVDSENFKILLEFQDKSKEILDFSFLFKNPKGLAHEIVLGGFFQKCFIESGALAWANGYELCPDAIKMWASDQRKSNKNRSKRATMQFL